MNSTAYSYCDIVRFWHAVMFFFILIVLWVPACAWFIHNESWPLWFYDDVEHFLGGVFAFILYAILFFKESVSPKVFFFSCVGGSAFLGAVWEIWWYTLSFIVTGNPEKYISLHDTVTDLSYDIAGGICAGIYYTVRASRKRLS